MENYPSRHLEKAVSEIGKLPGIGKKTALRLALHLLRQSEPSVAQLADSLRLLKTGVKQCNKCGNLSDSDLCAICSSSRRHTEQVCIVQDVRDVMALENTAQYQGLYHVLGGLINPMEGIGPTDLNLANLVGRLQHEAVTEVIFALETSMEGETTAFYIYKKIMNLNLRISSIARGIAVGDALEYADEITLGRSIMQRVPYENAINRSSS